MEKSKSGLEAKRELLARELEQVDQEIADVNNRLSRLPSALKQLEAGKTRASSSSLPAPQESPTDPRLHRGR